MAKTFKDYLRGDIINEDNTEEELSPVSEGFQVSKVTTSKKLGPKFKDIWFETEGNGKRVHVGSISVGLPQSVFKAFIDLVKKELT